MRVNSHLLPYLPAAVLTALLILPGCSLAARAAPDPSVPGGFTIAAIATIPQARELAMLPDGDLLAGTRERDVYIVPGAEAQTAGSPAVFATLPDDIAAGVAFSRRRNEIYIATEHAVFATPYVPGNRVAAGLRKIASVRTGPIAPNSDGDVHRTTSVAVSGDTLWIAVGSSCNACAETDATRAAIFTMTLPDGPLVKRATRIRNAIALAVGPRGAVWAGDAGQDGLPFGHPYEFLDDVSAHRGAADYGWPQCEENRIAYVAGANCDRVVVPLVALPAYSTVIGATFYQVRPGGRFAFPPEYRGALFAALHGSWHRALGGAFAAAPQVVWIPMRGGRPASAVNWRDPRAQWHTFAGGFQAPDGDRRGRPTGLAVGSDGSLFVGDDAAGAIYRIRPER